MISIIISSTVDTPEELDPVVAMVESVLLAQGLQVNCAKPTPELAEIVRSLRGEHFNIVKMATMRSPNGIQLPADN